MNAIVRKLVSFSKDPIGSSSYHARRVSEQFRVRMRGPMKRWSRLQLNQRGLLALLDNRPAAAYAPYSEDLWYLYRLVRKMRPQCVLEFGAGCSTVILAQALHENGSGHLYSVDAVEYWARVTWESMPQHLQRITTASASEMVAVEVGGERVLRHATVPDIAPDFIFLDGPDFQDFKLGTLNAVCDPVDLESRFRPGFCMVVDGRVDNTAFLRRHLKRRYTVSSHWPQHPWETTVFRLEH